MSIVRNNKQINNNDDRQLPSKPCEGCTTWVTLCPVTSKRTKKQTASLGYLWQFFGHTSSTSACFDPIGGIELSSFKESRNVMVCRVYFCTYN